MGLLEWFQNLPATMQNNVNDAFSGIAAQAQARQQARQALIDQGQGLLSAQWNTRQMDPFGAVAEGFGGITSPVGKLPMDTASRMARAEAQGFRTDMPLYHSTPYDFKEFVPSNYRGASFFADTPGSAQNAANHGAQEWGLGGSTVKGTEPTGSQIMPVMVRGQIYGIDQFPEKWLPPKEITRSEWKAIKDDYKNWKPENASQYSESELNALRHLRANALDSYDTHPDFLLKMLNATDAEMANLAKIDEPMIRGNTSGSPIGYEGFEGPQGERWRGALQKAGFTGARISDEGNNTVAIFDPSNIRSRFAAFDPSKINSKDLLASFGGLLGLGAAADQANQNGLFGQ